VKKVTRPRWNRKEDIFVRMIKIIFTLRTQYSWRDGQAELRAVCVFSCEDTEPVEVRSRHIRPRARHKIHVSDISIGDRVMVNYNYDEPKSRGYWYDAVVTGKHVKRSVKRLTATVFVGYYDTIYDTIYYLH